MNLALKHIFEPFTKICLDTNGKRNDKTSYIVEPREYFLKDYKRSCAISSSGEPTIVTVGSRCPYQIIPDPVVFLPINTRHQHPSPHVRLKRRRRPSARLRRPNRAAPSSRRAASDPRRPQGRVWKRASSSPLPAAVAAPSCCTIFPPPSSFGVCF